MKIHEYQGRNLFLQYEIPVASGDVSATVEGAKAIAAKTGYPVVIKAQVLVGGRGKAGGVKVVANETELVSEFTRIKNLNIKGYAVETILVAKAIDIKKEYYVAVTVDASKDDVVIIASAEGGVEIEETAKTNPNAIKKFYLQGRREADVAALETFIKSVFSDARQQAEAKVVFLALIKCFFDNDCSLAEINPLVIDGTGTMLAADAKINLDDNALIRHEELQNLRDLRYEDADELEAKKCDLSFVKLEGSVGCIVNGAGLAMATMDIVNLLGGKPANFLDVGGSSNPQKVLNALKIILRNNDLKAILINIFGGITRCDDIANGILEAKSKIDMKVPLVVRLTGTNETQAKEILARAGINTYSTMREAVLKVVELAK